MEEHLQQVARLESLGALAAGVAHDFNNLLVSILGNTELALSELPETSAARPLLGDVSVAAELAADLTRQLLAYAGQRALDVQPVQVNDLINETVSLTRSVVSCGAVVKRRIHPALPTVSGDASHSSRSS